ncbi:MAG TPA: asparagine synthase-related protein [Solirubrobacterales bacterium]
MCGALGAYDPERVRRLAVALDPRARVVHEDGRSILALDREPLRWGGPGRCGLGWIEGDTWPRGPGPSDWQETARRGACGLVVDGQRRFVHSAVNGLAPIYWIDDGRATYFSSRIDPLVRSAPRLLSIDWDAWASILALRYPLGERTPFAEIRRLGPFSTLRRRFAGPRPRAHRWPWAEIEPHLSLDTGAEATASALRESLEALSGSVICPLSGGRDSRLLLSVLAAAGRTSLTALTVGDDEGAPFEEDLAAAVAGTLGVEHERIGALVEDYPADWEERARRVEHQFVDHAWLVPLARRIAGTGSPVLDGIALDTLMQTGTRFHTPEVLDLSDPRTSSEALFESLRRYGQGQLALAEGLRQPILERSRAQFIAVAKPFEGHPSQPNLALYASRTVRGISTYPGGLLGAGAAVLVPGAQDPVASAILAVPSAAKGAAGLQAAVQRLVDPRVAELPSTGEMPRATPHLPRRWRSEPALAAHRRRLAEGPFTPYLSPDLLGWLNDPGRGELTPDLRLGMEAVSLLHSWWHRYREHLREVNPIDLLA